MSIQQKIRIIQRAEGIVADLKSKYSSHSAAAHDLHKLSDALIKMASSLDKLDHLKPHHDTSEIDQLMRTIDLDNTILKGELQPEEFKKLNKGISAVKSTLKFHPTRYSWLEYIVLWFYELLYFV